MARYAITGIGLGNAGDFRDIIVPFVGELLSEAERLGCATEITPHASDSNLALVPERGRAIANAGHDLVVGFLLVVSGSIAGGVAQAVGTDIYQHALKKPVAGLVHRLRNGSGSTREVVLLAETWLVEEKVLFQAIVHWRPDQRQDVPELLADALHAAETFWRAAGSSRLETPPDGPCIVRLEITTDGSITRPTFVDPQHRMPGTSPLGMPTAGPHDDVDQGDD